MYIDMNSEKTYFYEEVLNMLNAGYSMVDIAKQITDDMNEAQAAYNEAQKAVRMQARKEELVTKIYDLVQAYMNEFAPDLANSVDDRDDNIVNVISGLDAFIDIARQAAAECAEVEIVEEAPASKSHTKVVEVSPAEADAILSDWLSKLGF